MRMCPAPALVDADLCLPHEVGGDLPGRAQGGNVHPGQERALRKLGLDARDSAEDLVHAPAPLFKDRIIPLGHELGVVHGVGHGRLECRVRRADDVDRAAVEHVHDVVVRDEVAHAHAAQGHALGHGADRDGPFPHAGQGGQRHHLPAVEEEVLKRLVHHRDEVVLDHKLREHGHLLPGKDRGRGVVGVGQQHHLRAGGEGGLQRRAGEAEAVRFVQEDGDGLAAQELGVQEIAGVAGVRHEHLVARLDEGHHRKQQAGIRSRGDEDIALRHDGEAVLPRELAGDGRLELRVANGMGVVRAQALFNAVDRDGLDRRGHAVVRHEGVGPAEHVAAGALHLLGRAAHVRLFHLAEQAALQAAEALAHLQSNVHIREAPSSGPQVRTKRRISRLSSRKKVLPPEKPIVSSSIMHTGWLSHSGTFCVMLSSSA